MCGVAVRLCDVDVFFVGVFSRSFRCSNASGASFTCHHSPTHTAFKFCLRSVLIVPSQVLCVFVFQSLFFGGGFPCLILKATCVSRREHTSEWTKAAAKVPSLLVLVEWFVAVVICSCVLFVVTTMFVVLSGKEPGISSSVCCCLC